MINTFAEDFCKKNKVFKAGVFGGCFEVGKKVIFRNFCQHFFLVKCMRSRKGEKESQIYKKFPKSSSFMSQ